MTFAPHPDPDAPGDPAGGVLVIGYGNTLRGDDGVGPRAAELLADDPRLAGATVLARHQLTPELALEVAGASFVVLVDATLEQPPGEVVVRPLEEDPRAPTAEPRGTAAHGAPAALRGAAQPGATSHHVGAGMLLELARELYGAAPPAIVVSVGVADLAIGETLSPAVAAALPATVEAVAGRVEEWLLHRAGG